MNTIKLIFITLLALFIYSCSEDSVKNNEKPVVLSAFDELLEEFGLRNNGIIYESVEWGINGSHIFFNGREENKLRIECIEYPNKESHLSWTSEDELQTKLINSDESGEQKIHEFNSFSIHRAYSYNHSHVVILKGLSSNSTLANYNVYFISKNMSKIIESLRSNLESYAYTDILPWYEDKIIITKSSCISDEIDSCFCYSLEGNELYKFEKHALFPTTGDLAIDISSYIRFTGGLQGAFVCNDIKANLQKWKSTSPLTDLPNDTRIDKVKLSRHNSSSIICNFTYTLPSGKKGEKDYILDIKTGTEIKE